LSCGGPIISPNNENFVITPIAPHNLNVRPLVVNDKVEIKFRVESRSTILSFFRLKIDPYRNRQGNHHQKSIISASSGTAQQS
jgi:NAD kinase